MIVPWFCTLSRCGFAAQTESDPQGIPKWLRFGCYDWEVLPQWVVSGTLQGRLISPLPFLFLVFKACWRLICKIFLRLELCINTVQTVQVCAARVYAHRISNNKASYFEYFEYLWVRYSMQFLHVSTNGSLSGCAIGSRLERWLPVVSEQPPALCLPCGPCIRVL